MSTLSVIIPTKNEEELLPKLLSSIREQTMQPVDVVVADSHSDDRTPEIARSFGAVLVDGGTPSGGRNRGADIAKGEVLLFLDADVILPDATFFERILREFDERQLAVTTCDMEPLSESRLDHIFHRFYNRYVRIVRPIMAHCPGSFVLVRHAIHREIKGFDETIVFCEDHDYARRAAKKGKFGFLNSGIILISPRRLHRDGHFTIAFKFLLAEMHLLFLGPIRHDWFHYTFGHKKKG